MRIDTTPFIHASWCLYVGQKGVECNAPLMLMLMQLLLLGEGRGYQYAHWWTAFYSIRRYNNLCWEVSTKQFIQGKLHAWLCSFFYHKFHYYVSPSASVFSNSKARCILRIALKCYQTTRRWTHFIPQYRRQGKYFIGNCRDTAEILSDGGAEYPRCSLATPMKFSCYQLY
jgi:hypothetical protein